MSRSHSRTATTGGWTSSCRWPVGRGAGGGGGAPPPPLGGRGGAGPGGGPGPPPPPPARGPPGGSMRVTSPARTWRDLAGVLPPAALLAVTDQLLDRRCSRADLAQQLARRPTGRGCARAREVLPVGDPRAESPMESVLRWILH